MKPLLGPNFPTSQIVVLQLVLEEIAQEIAGDVEALFMKMTSALRHRLSVSCALALGSVLDIAGVGGAVWLAVA